VILNSSSTARDVRQACRSGAFTLPTAGLASGFAQANLVILPRDWAFDFLLFCQRNPQPCPLLEVTDPGDPVPRLSTPDADLRTDLPGYRVWKNGELVQEPDDITQWWRDDLVSFLIGCSFTFEAELLRNRIPVRHLECGCNVPMYRTNRPCVAAGTFAGPLVVSMRPLAPADVIRAVEVTSAFPNSHGSPVHFGDPEALGISDLSSPDFGDAVPIHDGEVPVFWACGVTPQAALAHARPPLAITHQPGKMFLTDLAE
jgi:uncharacterized protein YcsI (UPF0317 family)